MFSRSGNGMEVIINIGRAVEKTALNMLKQKLDSELITSVTGLSSEDILKLKNKL